MRFSGSATQLRIKATHRRVRCKRLLDADLVHPVLEVVVMIAGEPPSRLRLDEPQRIKVRIVDVKFPRAPALVDRPFMYSLGSVRIPRRV